MRKRTTAILRRPTATTIATGVVLASHQFPDVPDDHTFHTDIDWLVTNGITTGYPNGNFGPEDFVTRGQMSAFLHRMDTNLGQTEYGVASIVVSKGGGAAIPHAAYSIPLGSPVADTTGGVFRMTCDADEAPCTIAVKAAALSDTDIGGTVRFLPRVLVMKGGTPVDHYCARHVLRVRRRGRRPAGPNESRRNRRWEPSRICEYVSNDIGGSADCGVAGPGGDSLSASLTRKVFHHIHASFAFFNGGARGTSETR